MAEALRSTIGVDQVHYAVYNQGTGTYGTITALPQVRNISFGAASSTTYLYADNGVVDSAETTGDKTVTLEVTDMLRSDIAAIFGHSYANGILVEAGADTSAIVALGCRVLKSGGIYEYIWYPRVRLQKPDTGANTKEASVEFQTMTMEGAVIQDSNGIYRCRARSDDATVPAGTLTGWFNTVVTSNSVDATALTATIAEGAGGDDKKIVVTFAKGSGASFSINSASVTSDTIVITDSTGGKIAGTYAVGNAGTTVTVKFTPTAAWSGGEVIGVVVTNGVKDTSNVSATVTGDVITID